MAWQTTRCVNSWSIIRQPEFLSHSNTNSPDGDDGLGSHLLSPAPTHRAEAAQAHPGEASLLPARKLKPEAAADLQSLCSQQHVWEQKAEASVPVLRSNKPHWLLPENLPPFPRSAHSLIHPNPCKPTALLGLKGFVPRSSKSHNTPRTVRAEQVTFSATGTACWEQRSPWHGVAGNRRCPSCICLTQQSLRRATLLKKGHFHFNLVDSLPFMDLLQDTFFHRSTNF